MEGLPEPTVPEEVPCSSPGTLYLLLQQLSDYHFPGSDFSLQVLKFSSPGDGAALQECGAKLCQGVALSLRPAFPPSHPMGLLPRAHCGSLSMLENLRFPQGWNSSKYRWLPPPQSPGEAPRFLALLPLPGALLVLFWPSSAGWRRGLQAGQPGVCVGREEGVLCSPALLSPSPRNAACPSSWAPGLMLSRLPGTSQGGYPGGRGLGL